MKICYPRYLRLRNRNSICWTKTLLAFLIWTCCCYQGDESRPLTDSHVRSVKLECHVILEDSLRKYAQLTCSCKCWIRCQDTKKCPKWHTFIHNIESSMSLQSSELSPLRDILVSTYSSCCKPSSISSVILEKNFLEFDLKCITNHKLLINSTYCGNVWNQECCVVFCLDNRNQSVCSYFKPDIPLNDFPIFVTKDRLLKKHEENTKEEEEEKGNLLRSRRSSENMPPYKIEVLENFEEIAVLQPFNLSVRLLDKYNVLVENFQKDVKLIVEDNSQRNKIDLLQGELTSKFANGQAKFFNIYFIQTGSSFKLSVSSSGPPEIVPWLSNSVSVTERKLFLRPSGRRLPINPRENDTLSPAAGVIIYDTLNNAPADRKYLSKYTWEGSIGLLYDDIYPGTVLGTTVQTAEYQSNEIIFNDIVLSNWGYSYILKINIRAKETSFWNLTCLLGPFDVDMISTFELPLVESDEFRRLQILFNVDFQIVTKDQRKFEIFFLNYFGTKYSSVKWKNVTVSEGSVVVDFTITGLTDDLDKTSQTLASDIGSGKADIEYPKGTVWKANRESTLSRKLLENPGTTDGQSDDGGGGLSVAWIVAIVINVVLIVVFIFAIIYCWLRRKKQQDSSRASSALQNFDGQPETMMYANKAESKKKSMEQKAALMDARPRDIFTIEDGRKKLHKHDHEDEGRCNCFSPECYCSVGDGRKTESQLDRRSVEDENVDDPQGYPTPSPQPTFPTPEPTPEPEDFWRPDSFQQEEEEEEEEEFDDMPLPGAISEPEPVSEQPAQERYYVYHVTDIEGSRELIGQMYLEVDSFLNDVRRDIDRNRDLSEAIRRKEYRFLDENYDAIPNYQESSLDLERVFPSQEINIQCIKPQPEKLPEPKVEKMPKIPAYVGPLGICSASDCTRAAKIKCLDCRNTAYCSKRCMRDDIKEHKRVCYKPAWRI